MVDKASFSKVCLYKASSGLWADKSPELSEVINLCPSWWGGGSTYTSLCPAFRQLGGQRAESFSFILLLVSAHNNP